jgi:hypothetical protein
VFCFEIANNKTKGVCYELWMQYDNNLVLYCSSPDGIFSGWSSNTYNKGNRGTGKLYLQDDGILTVSDDTNIVLWASRFVFNII